jgi:hypothetical protein
MARVAVLAALLMGAANIPAAAMTDTRVDPDMVAPDAGKGTDWLLVSVACVTLLVGRTVAYRRKKPDRGPRP